MHRGRTLAAIVGFITSFAVHNAHAQMRAQTSNEEPALEATPTVSPGTTPPSPEEADSAAKDRKEKMSRVWANEPPLVRLARDKFGGELTENDAKLFNAVASSTWADYRPTNGAKYTSTEPKSWNDSAKINADRITWLFSDPAAAKLIPTRGICVRGLKIEGKVDLYRCNVPASQTFYECMFSNTLNLIHATLQYLDIRNC
jgi:hypothetical protein